jgi:MYXO-CTERM domain-containing protein
VSGCDGFDDLDVASRSIHAGDVWVTRLRADLPVSALSTDLKLAASDDQSVLSPEHKTSKFTDPTFDPCGVRSQSTSSTSGASAKGSVGSGANGDGADGCACRTAPSKDGLGTWVLIGSTVLGLSLVVRRRRVPPRR